MKSSGSRRWRSLLFVPGNNARLLEGAPRRAADALVIDLEDAVAPTEKAAARSALDSALDAWRDAPFDTLVRVNADAHLDSDLDAAVRAGVVALMVPKVECADVIRQIEDSIAARERQRDLPKGAIRLVPIIETPAALMRLDDIAACSRVSALAFGSEDFALSLGVPPSQAALSLPCQMVALAAAAHGIHGYGVPSSIADFRDVDTFRQAAGQSRAFGIRGGLCIHPAQVAVLNDVFSPSAEELRWARAVVDAWSRSGGSGVASLEGKMIDRPVIERARMLLEDNPSTESRT